MLAGICNICTDSSFDRAVLKCKGLFFIFFLFEGFKNAASQCQVGVAEALQHLASGGATLAVFGIEYGKKKVEWSGTTS